MTTWLYIFGGMAMVGVFGFMVGMVITAVLASRDKDPMVLYLTMIMPSQLAAGLGMMGLFILLVASLVRGG